MRAEKEGTEDPSFSGSRTEMTVEEGDKPLLNTFSPRALYTSERPFVKSAVGCADAGLSSELRAGEINSYVAFTRVVIEAP